MDYHDNDYEDQNLRLAGEEISKVSSVLLPFALPKFDLDDNLHGNLKFDCLVENEVFLGIPSQEDNQWIGGFSRGSGDIVFSSSPTEVCALPRRSNVWSEATSSESVEMLLKAVGQEGMIPGENVVGDSNSVDQMGSLMKQMEVNSKQYGQKDEVGDDSSSWAPETELDVSKLNKFSLVEDVHVECTLDNTNVSLGGVHNSQDCSLVTDENLSTCMMTASDDQGEPHDLLNESPGEQVPAVPNIGIHNTEGSSQVDATSPGKVGVQDVVIDTGFVSAGCEAKGIFEEAKEDMDKAKITIERTHVSDPENLENPAKLESVKNHSADIHVPSVGKAPSLHGEGESESLLEGFNEVAFCVDDCEVFPSPEMKQLCEDCGMLPEQSVLLKGGLVEGMNMKMSSDGALGNSTDSSFTSECCVDKTVIEDVTDATNAAFTLKDHALTSLLAGKSHTGREHVPSDHLDAHECKQDVTICDKEACISPSDSAFVGLDDSKREMSTTFLGQCAGVNDETSIEAPLKASKEDFPDNLDACHELGSASRGIGSEDQSNDTELSSEKHISSMSKDSFEVADEFTPGIKSEQGTLPDSAAAGASKTADRSAFSLVTSSGSMLDQSSKDANESSDLSASALNAQDGAVEATSSEKPKEAEVQGSGVTNFLLPPELGESSQLYPAGDSSAELSQSEVCTPHSLNNNEANNIGNVLPPSLKSEAYSISKEEGTFTFDLRHLASQSVECSSIDLPSNPSIQAYSSSMTGEGTPSTAGSSKLDPMTRKEIPFVSLVMPDVMSISKGPKVSTERKSRRGSNKSAMESLKKGNQVKKTMSSLMQTEGVDKSQGLLSPLIAGQVTKFETILQPKSSVSIPTSSILDLNSSTTSSSFQQPFTDLQQLQLRAQIFVYGSLIQGVAPEEAYMVSALDGGRSIWEPTWRACVKRLHGAVAPEQINRQTFPRTEVHSSPSIRPCNKAISSPVVNPMISLSSPLWNISTPFCEALPSSCMSRSSVFDYQVVSPLHQFQSPPIRNLMDLATSWQSQGPFPVPWLPSSQASSYDVSSNYPSFPIPESLKLTPSVKESYVFQNSGTKHVSSIPTFYTGGTTILPGTSSFVDLKKVTVSAGQSPYSKNRKRKKSSGAKDVLQTLLTASPAVNSSATVGPNQLSNKASDPENLIQTSLLSCSPVNLAHTPVGSSHYSASISITTPSFMPKGASNQFLSDLLPIVSGDHHKSGDLCMDKRILKVEEFSKVNEAKLQAEEASIQAAAAVRQCQVFWSQLEQQKKSGLTSDFEAKLASAAVVIAAAASIAKAAAAAAKIASNVAIQAQQMAAEATVSGTVNTFECDIAHVSSSSSYIANATPISILKGGDRNHPGSVISAAREVARKRVMAASAATRHAENLDAILKAAELTAHAVSHVGKISTMGDPLSELVVTGPDCYWKIPQVASVPDSKLNEVNPEISNVGEGSSEYVLSANHVMSVVDDHFPIEKSLVASIEHRENNLKACRKKNVTDSANIIHIPSELHSESRLKFLSAAKYASEATIKEGSLVEVFKDHGDIKKAWYLANVLSLKDGEALVCYSKLQSDQGPELLKEWVPVEAKDGNPAMIRSSHPMPIIQIEGTRKRRRAMKDYDWSVGDKVDAWVQDCWREGIIAENNKIEQTALNVHFPAQGETVVVKVCHLRPTRIWNDGQWVEWCRTEQDRSQSDTPKEKRAKLGSSVSERGKSKVPEDLELNEIGKNEEPNWILAANEKAFNIGIMTTDGNRPCAVRTMRSGLQKEGSRVVFGVPKPGKKRKFMEVSKHYVSDSNNENNVPSDSVKLSTFLTQGSGSRGWKSNYNIDSREKQATDVKYRGLKPGKPPTVPSRTVTLKGDSSSSRLDASDATLSEVKGSVSNDRIEQSEHNLPESGSYSNVSEGPIIFSSQAHPPENHKKNARVAVRSERFNKGKVASATGELAKSVTNEKIISDAAERRRSNRRIQPTSRLLEGLQSSLMITKFPFSSHEKSHSKGTSRGNSSLLQKGLK